MKNDNIQIQSYEIVRWGYYPDGSSDFGIMGYDAEGNPIDLDGSPIGNKSLRERDLIAETEDFEVAMEILGQLQETDEMQENDEVVVLHETYDFDGWTVEVETYTDGIVGGRPIHQSVRGTARARRKQRRGLG